MEAPHDPKTCMSRNAMHALFEMHTSNMLCDATITLEDHSVLNVHRAILCSCSEYFRAVFTTSLNAGQTDVFVPKVSTAIMKRIIDYAYLRQCDIDERCVHELYVHADYVAMLGLMQLCIEFMVKMLRPENCIGLMLFARARSCDKLYSAARKFVLRQFVEVARHSLEILAIEVDEFYDIISDDMLNTKDEEPVWECCIRWIDHDPPLRAMYVTKLMQGIRLGLLPTGYFMQNVQEHPYVTHCPDARPLIIDALRFLHDLDLISTRKVEMTTPDLALPRLPHDVIFAIGGWSSGLPQTYIETYDTRADRWIRVLEEDPAGPRSYHGTAVIGERIYCIGGFDGMEYFNTCRMFNAITKEWREIAPMHYRRCYVSVAALDGLIYACGGYDGQNRQSSAERYDPATNQWTMIPSMNAQRSDAHACVLGDRIYVTGGFNGQECMNTVEFFEPVANVWTPVPSMLTRRSGVACIGLRGNLYVIGGFNGLARMNTCERYNPETQQWTSIREMYHPRSNFGIEIIDDMIFAIGGFNGLATIAHTECYDADRNLWLEATDMNVNRSALTANVVSGLSNVRDYTHKDRQRLMEERRQRVMQDDAHTTGAGAVVVGVGGALGTAAAATVVATADVAAAVQPVIEPAVDDVAGTVATVMAVAPVASVAAPENDDDLNGNDW